MKANVNDLPMWTEIHIQPLSIDGNEDSKVYWIKHPHLKLTVYSTDFDEAVDKFLEITKKGSF